MTMAKAYILIIWIISSFSYLTCPFFNSPLGSIVGMHILLKLMEECKAPFDLKLCRTARYTVNVPKNCAVKFPAFIEINDQCSLDLVKVPIGLRRDRVMPQSVSIALVSLDLLETRNYEIHLPLGGTNDTTPSLKS